MTLVLHERDKERQTKRKNISYLEASLLELHDAGVVDAGSLGEDENGKLVRVLNVLLQSRKSFSVRSDIPNCNYII